MKKHILDTLTPKGLPKEKLKTFDAKAEALKKIRKDADRYKLQQDCGYYTTIIFQSREQVEAFCKAVGLLNEDKSCYFIDGMHVARKKGIKLPEADMKALEQVYYVRSNSYKDVDDSDFIEG